MSKITRALQKIFGDGAGTGEFGIIGSKSSGLPATTKDIDNIQSDPNYSLGLFGITSDQGTSRLPYTEDMNSLFFMLTTNMKYMYQSGIPEWNIEDEYYNGISLVLHDGKIWKSISGVDLAPNKGNQPNENLDKWELLTYSNLTVSDLRLFTGGVDGQELKLSGHTLPGDVQMPPYFWDSSDSDDDNNGSRIKPTAVVGPGRWKWSNSVTKADPRTFGCDSSGGTNNTNELQEMVDSGISIEGSGTYKLNTSLLLKSGITIKGLGKKYSLKLYSDNDIEILSNSVSERIDNVIIDNVFIEKTVTGLTEKYEIHLSNPQVVTIKNSRVKSGHIDSQYSDVNVGGIWLEKTGAVTTAFLNHIENCWIQNNSIRFDNLTDSTIVGTYVWGHTREFTIGLFGSTTGAIDISGNPGLICSRYLGGIYLATAGQNQIRIINNEFDGNPALILGKGVFLAAATSQCIISGNTFWRCGDHAVHAIDPVGLIIDGNNFWKNNGNDDFQDDIRIEGVGFTPSRNVTSNNTHYIDEAKNNPGYAYNEVGLAPTGNLYNGNAVTPANYNPSLINYSETGSGEKLIHSGNSFDPQLRQAEERATVNPNGGILDMSLGDETSNSGYVGTLYVSLRRSDFATQSRQSIYDVFIIGSTGVFTLRNSNDGIGGGIPFTVSLLSSGIIRLVNTSTDSGQIAKTAMFFDGIKNRI